MIPQGCSAAKKKSRKVAIAREDILLIDIVLRNQVFSCARMGAIIWQMYMYCILLNLCGIFLRVLIAGVSMPFVEKKTISCKVLMQVPIVLK